MSSSFIPIKNVMDKEFWGITTYFNPEGYSNKLSNYRAFRESSKRQGLNLLTIELAFGDNNFELSEDDADIIVRVRSDSVLWHKERLLNIALSRLPKQCTIVAWLDADIIFLNENWIRGTKKALEKYKVVQLFENTIRLNKIETKLFFSKKKTDFVVNEERIEKGIVNFLVKKKNPSLDNDRPRPGFAWAAKKDLIKKIGFYDKLFLGSGDYLMLIGFLGRKYKYNIASFGDFPELIQRDALSWIKKTSQLVNGRVFGIKGNILHLYHGSTRFRIYRGRYQIIKDLPFDPEKDLVKNKYGCYEWRDKESNLAIWVRKYFSVRNEEGSLFKLFISIIQNPVIYFKLKVGKLLGVSQKELSNLLLGSFILISMKSIVYRILLKIRKPSILGPNLSRVDDVTVIYTITKPSNSVFGYSVDSIKRQDYPKKLVKIMILDCLQKNDYSKKLKKFASRVGAEYYPVSSEESKNKLACLNIGIKRANTKYVLCGEPEMLFDRGYLRKAVDLLIDNPNRILICKSRDIGDNDLTKKGLSKRNFSSSVGDSFSILVEHNNINKKNFWSTFGLRDLHSVVIDYDKKLNASRQENYAPYSRFRRLGVNTTDMSSITSNLFVLNGK